ncbi:type 12 methyltransferase [Salmonella enterica subsp. enterica]|uniref:Type 12 methyltransferase n=1 Tax=Salmonella enterica I TaxID=59201 RepID=A0A447U2W8_SALET|nr:type 12 methyltransferase [Salmonella enterica subsp. enterica]
MALKPGGTLFGATILGKEVPHNAFGKKLMAVYNKKGIFSNTNDSADTLRSVLDEHFAKVTLEQHGAVALFFRHYATLIVSTGTSERSAARSCGFNPLIKHWITE